MKPLWKLAALLSMLLAASPALAHFVWVAVEKDSGGQPAAQVWFSELAEPDSADLLDRIAGVKVWSRSADGQRQLITLAKQIQGNGGAWVGAAGPGAQALSAHIQYGVLTRGSSTFLLQYYAKYLEDSAAQIKTLARDESLALDIVPEPLARGFSIRVLYQGQPASGAEVVIFDPAANQTDAKTDEKGRMNLTLGKPGLYSIRAKWVVTEAGKVGDKEYPQVNHYSTLALRVTSAAAQRAATPASAELSAAELVRRARAGRAVWQDFPGMEADLSLYAEGRRQEGRVRIAADGEVTLSGFELKNENEILSTLRSLVSHRMPGGESDDRVSFADDQTDHPHGRLIKLDYDSVMASAYRIKGDVIHEVNRQTDGGRFTISVLEVHRNAEGQYLPAYYTVSFWNKDGSLRSTSVIRETWVRVGGFDLPATRDGVQSAASGQTNVSMVFRNHKLL